MSLGDIFAALAAHWYILPLLLLGIIGLGFIYWYRRRTGNRLQETGYTVSAIVMKGQQRLNGTIWLDKVVDSENVNSYILNGRNVVLLEDIAHAG